MALGVMGGEIETAEQLRSAIGPKNLFGVGRQRARSRGSVFQALREEVEHLDIDTSPEALNGLAAELEKEEGEREDND